MRSMLFNKGLARLEFRYVLLGARVRVSGAGDASYNIESDWVYQPKDSFFSWTLLFHTMPGTKIRPAFRSSTLPFRSSTLPFFTWHHLLQAKCCWVNITYQSLFRLSIQNWSPASSSKYLAVIHSICCIPISLSLRHPGMQARAYSLPFWLRANELSKWVLLLSWATGSCYWVCTSREPFDLWSGVPVLGNKLVPFTWISFSNLDMFCFESCDLLQFSLNEIKNNEQLTSCFQENWWRRLPVETAFLKSGVRHRNT